MLGSQESPTAFLPEDNEPALLPFVAKMTNDLLQFDESPKEVEIVDENGNLLLAGDNDRRFFEAAWLHKYNGKYYFLIQPVILILFATQLVIIHMAHLPTVAEY